MPAFRNGHQTMPTPVCPLQRAATSLGPSCRGWASPWEPAWTPPPCTPAPPGAACERQLQLQQGAVDSESWRRKCRSCATRGLPPPLLVAPPPPPTHPPTSASTAPPPPLCTPCNPLGAASCCTTHREQGSHSLLRSHARFHLPILIPSPHNACRCRNLLHIHREQGSHSLMKATALLMAAAVGEDTGV